MRCQFSKDGEDGGRIRCNKPADKIIREPGLKGFVAATTFRVCLKHFIAWTRHPKCGYGLGGGKKDKGGIWD